MAVLLILFGFFHSDDYTCEEIVPITDDILSSATIDILKAISCDKGFQNVFVIRVC